MTVEPPKAASGTGSTEAPISAGSVELLVSIVVNNYNYARFVGTAIESALSQTYPHIEVVVVDDGSADDSRAVISRFGDRIVPVFKENGGQGSAFNAGFAASTGSLVIFLDSDDFLYPTAVERVVGTFEPGVVKVHFRMTVVDGEGRAMGEYPSPDSPLHDGDVVPILLERGHYSSAVGSGNAYSRWALERVLPVPEEDYGYAADGYLIVTVPFHGEVRAIDVPLAAYRQHGGNNSSMATGLDPRGFHFTIGHQLVLDREILRRASEAGYPVSGSLVLRDAGHLQARLASLRVFPGVHPVPGDRRLGLAARGVLATWRYVDMSTTRRLFDTAWFLSVALLPRSLASRAVAWKFVRPSRPRAVRWAVRQIRRLTG